MALTPPGPVLDLTTTGQGQVTIGLSELGEAIGAPETMARRVLAVASAIVTEYAPQAPNAVLNEAVIRLGGYLAQSDYGGIRQEKLGPREVEYTVNHAPLLRLSGALALLTRYKHRRAGAI